ncbi:TIGR04282 family arsenosugar biosynthesis glycosyltransferase [Demetria terragena]|uniref:TIGR04282 family arsenosugar biosynthesis glycosyltransferase n=1 Tax=Demetria terragena TaxID=63959 RepID=UPI000371A3BF|nr:DUF2064 domain-containing protein [Demetria terragena]
MSVELLLVAKAPVPGLAKTRLGATVGMTAAADLAAAALLDSIDLCANVFPGRCHLALDGDLRAAARGMETEQRLSEWAVFGQEGETFAERLAHAHRIVGAGAGVRTLQIGMDTPQISPDELRRGAEALDSGSPLVLGPAADGGWWLLGLGDPRAADALADVPMSQPDTRTETVRALRKVLGEEIEPVLLAELVDIDDASDAQTVADTYPTGRFSRLWAELSGART